MASELQCQVSPDLVFESHASSSTGVMELPAQAAEVAPGPGRSVPGYSPAVADRLRYVNQALFFDAATARSDTIAIDQYPDFLGHGNNANLHGCPYCGAGNASWLEDQYHPNSTGHAHIALKWHIAFRGMLGQKCGRFL